MSTRADSSRTTSAVRQLIDIITEISSRAIFAREKNKDKGPSTESMEGCRLGSGSMINFRCDCLRLQLRDEKISIDIYAYMFNEIEDAGYQLTLMVYRSFSPRSFLVEE